MTLIFLFRCFMSSLFASAWVVWMLGVGGGVYAFGFLGGVVLVVRVPAPQDCLQKAFCIQYAFFP